MGVAAIVLNILGTVNTSTSITLLGIGLFALALDALDRGKSRSLMITNPMCKFFCIYHLCHSPAQRSPQDFVTQVITMLSHATSAGLGEPLCGEESLQ